MASRAAQSSVKGENAPKTQTLHVWPFKQAALFGCFQFALESYLEVQLLTNTRRVKKQPRSMWAREILEQVKYETPLLKCDPYIQEAHCLRDSIQLCTDLKY